MMKKVVFIMFVFLLLLTSCGSTVAPISGDPQIQAPSGMVEFVGEHYIFRAEERDWNDEGNSYRIGKKYWVSSDEGITWVYFSESITLDKSEYRIR